MAQDPRWPGAELPRLNSIARRYSGYTPTRPARSADGRSHLLNRNENPFGPLPSVRGAIAAAASQVNRYPDPTCERLIGELTRHLGVAADHLAVAAGSGTLLQALFAAVAGPGASVVYAWRSFEFYPLLSEQVGLRSIRVPLTAARHDLDAMAAAVGPGTGLVLVCNPNNPTGTTVSEEALARFLGSVPATCLVVLDEAYCEYAPDHPSPGVRLLEAWPNLIVLRTFSKAYGLAGLRVGYMIAHPYLIARMRLLCLPFAVSDIAQAAAVASLRADGDLAERVAWTVAERARVRRSLRAAGFDVPPSEANFVWVPLGQRTSAFAAACAAAGVNVQPFAGEGVRVSIGSTRDNDAFLAVAGRHAAPLPRVGSRPGTGPRSVAARSRAPLE